MLRSRRRGLLCTERHGACGREGPRRASRLLHGKAACRGEFRRKRPGLLRERLRHGLLRSELRRVLWRGMCLMLPGLLCGRGEQLLRKELTVSRTNQLCRTAERSLGGRSAFFMLADHRGQ